MTSWTALAAELLPPRLQEFVRLIGLSATMLLVERFGGLRIYIPASPTQDHPFAELIGFEKLCALSAEYGIDGTGLRFELPRALRALNAVRNARIRSDFVDGKSVRTLAAEHRLTERHVTRIVADIEPKDERQAGLAW
ncbi:Mor transcription activator family protein [Variovorax paradoxus]|uniref:Mor transcription activator family protein n=1 Tax=Variovorax paradoxus TaxID=34073 RepID=A0A0H2M5L5_VARPD|nr:Mor transcription activator family protein [Variovorax paradoxus]KLN57653.1 Mor transcription activator family protein [Variovorax paradoxus]